MLLEDVIVEEVDLCPVVAGAVVREDRKIDIRGDDGGRIKEQPAHVAATP